MYICKDTSEIVNTYQEYLKTKHWLRLKAIIYSKYKYKCAYCSTNKSLNIHHKTYENVGNEKHKDLVYLCSHCHESVHKKLIDDSNLRFERKKINPRKNNKKKKNSKSKKKKFVRKPKCSAVKTYKLSEEELKKYRKTT